MSKQINIQEVQARRYETFEKEKENLMVRKVDNAYTINNLGKASEYQVTKIDNKIQCTCQDYHRHKEYEDFRCKHIIAVLNYARKSKVSQTQAIPAVKEVNPITVNETIIIKKEDDNMCNNNPVNNQANESNNMVTGNNHVNSLQDILNRPFPVEQIKQRKGSFGKMLSYVETWSVIDRLNEAFKYKWSWEIISHEINNRQIVCTGRLSVRIDGEMVTKEAFGSKEIETLKADKNTAVNELGDDLKAACSDALKKAASLLGIGLHLYRGGAAPTTRPTYAPTTRPAPVLNLPSPTAPGSAASSSYQTQKPVVKPVNGNTVPPVGGKNNGNGNGGNGSKKYTAEEIKEMEKFLNRW